MEKTFISKYRNDGLLITSKRLLASFIDALILIITSLCLLIGSNSIIQTLPSYKNKINLIDEYRINMYKISEEAKLYEYKSNSDGSKNYSELIQLEDLFIKYALSNILYSYNTYKTNWDDKYNLKSDNPYEYVNEYNVSEASYSNDYLATFYVVYAKKYNNDNNIFKLEDNESYESHYKNVLKNNSLGSDWEYFIGDDNKLPCLKMDYAHTLLLYIVNNEGGQDGLNTYNYLASQYKNVFNEASKLLFNSNRYQDNYKPYINLYRECSIAIDISSVISYLLSFILVIVLPTIILKDGRSIGLLIFKGRVINKEGFDLSIKELIIRYLMLLLSYFPIMIVSNFFSGGLDGGWLFPIINIGNMNISMFNLNLLFLVFPIINIFMLIINKNKMTLTELVSSSIVVDTKNHVETVINSINKGNNKKVELVAIDKPYFDSTSFNNTERDKLNNLDDKNKN